MADLLHGTRAAEAEDAAHARDKGARRVRARELEVRGNDLCVEREGKGGAGDGRI